MRFRSFLFAVFADFFQCIFFACFAEFKLHLIFLLAFFAYFSFKENSHCSCLTLFSISLKVAFIFAFASLKSFAMMDTTNLDAARYFIFPLFVAISTILFILFIPSE